MAITHGSVTVGTTATIISSPSGDTSGTSSVADVARSVIITNPTTTDVFVGGPGVTATNYGYKLAANGGEISLDLLSTDELYGVVASGTADVRVLHTGV